MKSLTIGGPSEEFGICSEISSASPDYLYVNIFFVDGTLLDLAGNSCMYAGEKVKFTHHQSALTKSDQYAHAKKEVLINGKKHEVLVIAAVHPAIPADATALCSKMYEEVTGEKSPLLTKNGVHDGIKIIDSGLFGMKKITGTFR